ncbi:hypothetical protein DSCW_37700 [Desulfosarcina widdelii]|uniref:ADP,ATP carrier protein n=1 Tax=Desulfosarcina widdelii TaxID=947919 RepID=A0A5K7Z922_9BACT|nr:Npt1/Npt2 family nucleotide transporter [Desulfosarcina widdelii]BBO76353.1 hypothetical protein DSCW_37700 [Desulfosarcina widdelii]
MTIQQKIGRWFNVHGEETGLFLWTMALLFLLRSSGIFLNNYAETAFLKRYGVEYMPIVNMINAVVTFFVMGVMTGFMTRLPGARLLSRLFVFCGLSIGAIRAVIPFGIDLIYPALFMLKSQYEVLLALLFWNLANDLFNTRQSKRLFPLITAGGVVGQILGSFATPLVARWLHLDNLLLLYMITALAGAWAVQAMGRRYPTLLFQQNKKGESKKGSSMIEEFKTVLPLMKSSVLVKILIVLTFMPNVVIPIMNYQFNFAVNEQFATESGLIEFFGYFRGVLNIVSLIILLFVGKLYDRFGLSVALMFHPFNYLLVFIIFLFRFDAVGAMYARMSSNIIRTTINIPATAVVTGLFPESYRAMIRPFLRGTVVRIGLFLGSGLILLSDTLFHPRYLSLVAMPFVLVWLIAPFVLKRRYAGILLDLIADDQMDLRSLNADELQQVFRDSEVQQRLVERFRRESGENLLWIGQLLRSISVPNLDSHLLALLPQEPSLKTRLGLIDLLSGKAGPEAVEPFTNMIDGAEPDLIVAMIEAGQRMSVDAMVPFYQAVTASELPLDMKARALGALHRSDPGQFAPEIEKWLQSIENESLFAGIIAAGASRDARFAERLKDLLVRSDDDAIRLLILDSLRWISVSDINPLVEIHMKAPDSRMRKAALELFRIVDEAALKTIIPLLGDEEAGVADLARDKIRNADYQNSLRLIKSLSLPGKKVREALFDLLSEMSVKDFDVFRFVQIQARTCYQLAVQARGVRQLPFHPLQQLLAVHLDERIYFTLQTTLRVLTVQDPAGRMQKISRGLFSDEQRQRANSLEAMDDILDKSLSRLLVPFLEDTDRDGRIDRLKKLFPDEPIEMTTDSLINALLVSRNWVTLLLTLTLVRQNEVSFRITATLQNLAVHANPYVSRTAKEILEPRADLPLSQEAAMETTTISLTDKILHLKNIEIFSDLSINELAAVASVTEVAHFNAGETVFEEGTRGDTLYLVLEGEVAVVKECRPERAIELDSIGAGEYFGEMALFGDHRRSATIQAKNPARFLVLHKQELQEIVREFPQIALHVCRVLSMRIRRLHGKISDQVC